MGRKRRLAGLKLAPVFIIAVGFLSPIVSWCATALITQNESSLPWDMMRLSIGRTHWLAFCVAVITVVTTAPAALWVRFLRPLAGRLISFVVVVPVCVGMLARNYSWISIFSERTNWSSFGWRLLVDTDSFLHSDLAVHLVMVFVFAPWAFFIQYISLSVITSLHFQAAKTLGADDLEITRRILTPVLLRGAAVAFFLVYCSSLGYFITPRMIGSNTGDLAGNMILDFVELGEFGVASELSVALLLSSLPFVFGFLFYAMRAEGGAFSWRA